MTSKRQNRHTDVMHESSLVRRHFLAPVGFVEIPVGYARKNDVVILNFDQNGFIIEECVQKIDADGMANSVDLDQNRSRLIGVYTVCQDLSVRLKS